MWLWRTTTSRRIIVRRGIIAVIVIFEIGTQAICRSAVNRDRKLESDALDIAAARRGFRKKFNTLQKFVHDFALFLGRPGVNMLDPLINDAQHPFL